MESEKVKEIKKALEFNTNNSECMHLPYIDGYKCKTVAFADILTLINELESENERLKILLAQANAGIVNCSGCKLVELNAVKEFAERLKNKLFEFFQDNEELDGKISVGPLYVDVIGVEAKDGTIISLGLIDELLKEYEKWLNKIYSKKLNGV